jgi:hypothetical protein
MSSCNDRNPIAAADGPATMRASAIEPAGAAATELVEIDLWRLGPDKPEGIPRHTSFVGEQLTDGVALRFPITPEQGGLKGRDQLRIAGGSMSVSGGTVLYDESRQPLPIPDLREARLDAKLPADLSRTVTEPGPRDAAGRPLGRDTARDRPRPGRFVSTERGAETLAMIRAHVGASETRLDGGRLGFSRTEGDESHSWTFDERVGAVVDEAVDRGGRRYLTIHYDYSASGDGQVLTAAQFEWFAQDGRVNKRATLRYSGL